MKQEELFSYAYDFVSQIVDNKKIFTSLRRIILFGSVARGDFRENSDVDLFFEVKSKRKEVESSIKKEINKFEARAKNWAMRDIDLPFKVFVGSLNEPRWGELRDEILNYAKGLGKKFLIIN